MRSEKEMLAHIKKWAECNENVRSVVLTSSRVTMDKKTDFLSDYDIELYVSDIKPFSKDDGWLEEFGEVMVKWPYKPRATLDDSWLTRLVLFKDGDRIDFQITMESKVSGGRYDNGYEILVDKDNIELYIDEPTYTEFIINKPSEDEYNELVNEFWWSAYYVPKYLWRNELPFAKYMLDYVLRYSYVHKIVDWYIGSGNGWSIDTGALGKKYRSLLSDDIWKEYESTYIGGGIEENWEGFIKVTDFFRRIAKDIAEDLSYKYPDTVDKEVMTFCLKIKNTEIYDN